MSVFKCKMCGGSLDVGEGTTVCECEYCGARQTVPRAMDESMQNLFNRANTLRMKGEFDKAESIYEKIVRVDSTQSEAYWGIILCKYGIEYVDDPNSFEKIPTCHRASYDSIIADEDYKSALENADVMQKEIYEKQAKEIDRIQKDILALAQKEETYDVFICYKETDANGQRTQDSVIANDIYYQLKDAGFKVFYAAITLEGKLGREYEPIIFAALNSAKVMLTIGTKSEYFNAVWVKNEWSRFLKIIQKDRSKLLIPCYRDMDAYELPEEFAHLQAQDMSKIGFINDVVRGIKKVIKKDEPRSSTVINETVVQNANVNITPLLKRAFMFLEYGDWKSANDYAEKVLDQDPECANAYLVKLMAELKVTKKEELVNCEQVFSKNGNCQIALRFADDELKNFLEKCIETIELRNEQIRVEKVYNDACNKMKCADNADGYLLAAEIFKSIIEYKDSSDFVNVCMQKAEGAKQAAIRIAEENRLRAIELAEENKRIEEERIKKSESKNELKKWIGIYAILFVSFVVNVIMLVYSFSAMYGGFLYDWSVKLLVCSGVITLIAIIIALIFLIRKKSALKRMGKNAEPLDKKHFIFIASVFLVEIVLAIILWITNFKMVYPVTLNSVIALFIINIVMLSAYIVIMLWKRKGFIFVCIALALIVVLVTVYTIGCLVVDPFIYQESSDGSAYKIIGIRVWRSGEITIPSTHNGKPVVRVEQDPLRNSGGSSYEHLTKMFLPKGVEFDLKIFSQDGVTPIVEP